MKPPKLPILQGVLVWRGWPVPYVAAWSSEKAYAVRPDPLIGCRPALFRDGRRGEGRPLFGQMDEARTRRVVVERLCQVCAKPLRADGYVCDVPLSGTDGFPIVHEPPACFRCFRVALARCPGLAAASAKPDLLVARVFAYEVAFAPVRPVDGGDPALNATLRAFDAARGYAGYPEPIGYARAMLTRYRATTLAQLQAA